MGILVSVWLAGYFTRIIQEVLFGGDENDEG